MISITNKPNNGKDDDDQLMLSSPLWMEAPKITAISTQGILA